MTKEATSDSWPKAHAITRRELMMSFFPAIGISAALPLSGCEALELYYDFAVEMSALQLGRSFNNTSVVRIRLRHTLSSTDAPWVVVLNGWSPFILIDSKSALICLLTPVRNTGAAIPPLSVIDIPFFLGTGLEWTGRDDDLGWKNAKGREILDQFWPMGAVRDIPPALWPQLAWVRDVSQPSATIVLPDGSTSDPNFTLSDIRLQIRRTRLRPSTPSPTEAAFVSGLSFQNSFGYANFNLPHFALNH